jgi:hypothetical protein
MTSILVIPPAIEVPWAADAGPSYINDVPNSSTGLGVGLASWPLGFPPITMTPIELDGVRPFGQDFNGALNKISANTQYTNAGGQPKFNAVLATQISGYPFGVVLQEDAGVNSYINVLNGNTTNFNTTPASIGVSWLLYGSPIVSPTGGTIPIGGIITWGGYVADIPAGWHLCDGTDGTPDLSYRFIYGTTTDDDVYDVGGSANTPVVNHTHSISAVATNLEDVAFVLVCTPRTTPGLESIDGIMEGNSFGDDGNGSISRTNSLDVADPAGGVSGIDANIPPYIKLAYIMWMGV